MKGVVLEFKDGDCFNGLDTDSPFKCRQIEAQLMQNSVHPIYLRLALAFAARL